MDLKPCPFCGQKAEWINDDTEAGFDAIGYNEKLEQFICEMCSARGPHSRNGTKESAAEQWNTRI